MFSAKKNIFSGPILRNIEEAGADLNPGEAGRSRILVWWG
jgi:hypothetical protein